MWVTWGCLTFRALPLLAVSVVTGYNTLTYFTDNWKPLQCHEIRYIEVRSTIDCCLVCMRNLYSCAGYTLEGTGNNGLQCDVCYIYDVTTPLVTIQHTNNRVSGMPEVNKKAGTKGCVFAPIYIDVWKDSWTCRIYSISIVLYRNDTGGNIKLNKIICVYICGQWTVVAIH